MHSDWALNTVTREWCYRDGTRILLDKQDPTTSGVLKDKLIAQAMTKQMPPQKQYDTLMQELVDGKTAIQSLLLRELEYRREPCLARIKSQRLSQLFRDHQSAAGLDDDY